MTDRTPTADATDEAIMAAIAQGNVDMLGELYQRYGQPVRSLLFRLYGDVSPAEAEDLCHEVFLEVNRSARRYRHQGRLLSWLFGIAVRKAHGWRRKRWVRERLMGRYRDDKKVERPAAGGPESRVAARMEIDRALNALNQGQREVLLLHAVEGMGAEEIAEALGISVNTVWTRLHRARKAMRAALDPTGDPGQRD
jgi:RNA polymerase sigma-70 factor (ECF subfamily)